MSEKLVLLLIMILISGLFLYGCGTIRNDFVPEQVPLEDSIKEIILSKGDNYDFLNDQLFMQKVNDLGLSNDFTVGNLDEDSIPELVVYVERNSEDTQDPGQLQVYKFNGEKYELLDSIDMNYDNSNYLLVVGKIGQGQNGIFLSNQVGAHSTVNYGYILKDGKLKSVLNPKKLGLISTYPSNEIKDIDGDGILEFSIYSNDPESEEQSSAGSDKIILWYKWDGKDAGDIIQVHRMGKETSRVMNKNMTLEDLGLEDSNVIPYLTENQAGFSKHQMVYLLQDYINILTDNLPGKSRDIGKLLVNYQEGQNTDYIFEQYGLSLERLNDVEYLKREKILQAEGDLKQNLINDLSMGYRLESSQGSYYYLINYQKLVDLFSNNITNEYRDYLKLMAKESNTPYLMDGNLMITRDKLAERIIEIENFKRNYPYSIYVDRANILYKDYIQVFLFGSPKSPNYQEGNRYTEESIGVFKDKVDKYPNSYFSEILLGFISDLNGNLNILNEAVKEKAENNIL